MHRLRWLGHGTRWPQSLLVGLMLASLFFFNRDEGWDNWALYFFGAYGMGAAAFWAGNARRPGWLLGLLAGVGLLALAFEFPERLALALTLALPLGLLQWPPPPPPPRPPLPAPPPRPSTRPRPRPC